jgi:hypothetical protein
MAETGSILRRNQQLREAPQPHQARMTRQGMVTTTRKATGHTSSLESLLTQMVDDGQALVLEWVHGEPQTIPGNGEATMVSEARRRSLAYRREMVER